MDDVTRALEKAAEAADNHYQSCMCDVRFGCSAIARAAVLAFLKEVPESRLEGGLRVVWDIPDLAAAIEKERT